MTSPAKDQPAPGSGASRTLRLEELAREIAARAGAKRLIVAVAGPPGSGKSTTTDALQEMLAGKAGVRPQIVPMDGFHYDNAVLEHLRLSRRKGAPETFDAGGLEATLHRLRRAGGREETAVPVFDRQTDTARAGARLIRRTTNVVLAEGNYLLLKAAPWSSLQPCFDLTVMIECSEAVLRSRLMKRWLDLGLSQAEAAAKVETNDLPNARRVIAESRPAGFRLISRDG